MIVAAACHVHSDWSYDGKWSLHDLAVAFARRRYRVLLITEHDRGFSEPRFQQHRMACAEACSGDLLVVPGIEYSDPHNVIHVLTWGLPSFLGEGLSTAELLENVRANNGVAVLAHPARREAWMRYDSSWTSVLTGIELWNRKADGWAPSRAAAALLRSTDLIPFVSLDFHQRNQFFPLFMQLEIQEPVTEDSVISALRARRCHAVAFSASVEKFLNSWRGSALQATEIMRRTAAPLYRQLKRYRSVYGKC
jgi:hypothetical protein